MNTPKKITVPKIVSRKRKGIKIVMITAYDATFARLAESGGADMVLVGDSLGMVIQGHENTLPVTLDDVIYHTRAVSRGLNKAHLCGDMPFMTYKISPEQALNSAGRLIQEGCAESVKLEGGEEIAETIHRIVTAGIPVVGHVGLTPQSVHAIGGFKMQGKNSFAKERIINDARAVADAGAFCLVLESMPLELAETITQEVPIPTIGIGAGPHCDGQVLVIYDMLGMNEEFQPKFLKQYAEMGLGVREAVATYVEEVREGEFPGPEHSVSSSESRKHVLSVVYGSASKTTTH
ncbi:MAG: 3-methyl-2-oxobutanoate hydroxymethyltransferase [Proteobacteria bacterium]|nr:3-methyl-2-oxobutanoate hydroxymethyltransferase [Pseudomonadota bacterium]